MGIGLMEKEILELQEENSRLKMLSEADGLTGLYNRTTAENIIIERLKKNEGGNLMVVDVDGFKRINDRYGHLFGDEVLKGLTALMKEIFPVSYTHLDVYKRQFSDCREGQIPHCLQRGI